MEPLVGPEEAPQHAGPLLVVDPTDADQVGHALQAEGGEHGHSAGSNTGGAVLDSGGLPHPEADQDLRRDRHAEARRHESALAPAVEGEPPATREEVVEEGQVECRLLVRRGTQGGALGHQRQPAHRRVVQVGVERLDVGVTGHHRVQRRGRAGTLQVHPPLHVGGTGVRGVVASRAHRGWKCASRPAQRADAVHTHAVHVGRALVQLVAPRDGVERSRRQHLDLVALVRHQALGQHARPGLGAAPDGGAVARDHEGDLQVHPTKAGPPSPGTW